VFTARYALSPYIKLIRFFFKGLICKRGQGVKSSCPFARYKRIWSNRGRGAAILKLGIRLERAATRPGRFAPRDKTIITHWIEGWLGPIAGVVAWGEREIVCPVLWMEPRFLGRPARILFTIQTTVSASPPPPSLRKHAIWFIKSPCDLSRLCANKSVACWTD
jgi:hypothetical protein